jgi:hypothetical protein
MAMLAKNINVSKLKFSPPKTLNNQSRTVYVNYEGDKLSIQTPIMYFPYGVSDNEAINKANKKVGDETAKKKYDVSVSFRGMDDNKRLQELHDKMREIEGRVIDEAFENRMAWFRDDYDGNKGFVAKLFNPIVKYDKNKETGKIENKYPPTMRIKLPYDDTTDEFTFACSDMDDNEVVFKKIMSTLKGGKGRFIIQLGGVWIAGGRYGCTWRVVRAKVDGTSSQNVDFIPDSDDEESSAALKKLSLLNDEDVEEDAMNMANEVTPPKKVVTASKAAVEVEKDSDDESDIEAPAPAPASVAATPVVIESEEEEEEDEESEEDVPPPPPPPPKTTRKTKK